MWRYLQYTIFGLTVVLLTIHEIVFVQAGEQERVAWYEGATRAIEGRIRASAATWSASGSAPAGGVARGVVLFVGDGMGMSTLTAARILSGQRHGNTGEEAQLAWDSFPAVALARTYNMDAQVGESSACATALLCGVKANYETVGLDSSARFENCYSSFDARVPSLINWAQEQGKSTGLVTTTRVTHATPAALYAHAASRYWEDDGKVPPAARTSCKDIARQLLEDEPGRNINVILGGGRRHFVPKVIQDPEEPDKEGRRLDGRNLIEEWSRNHRLRNVAAKYVANKEQFESVDPRKVNHLLGLFSYSHMDFDVDRNTNGSGDPSLAEMTIKALRILAKNPEGYFLFVEGGRIDHAHHYNNAYRALDETLALEEAVRAVMKEVDLSETLLVVTADHSHVLTLGGLATHRGNPIFDCGSSPCLGDARGRGRAGVRDRPPGQRLVLRQRGPELHTSCDLVRLLPGPPRGPLFPGLGIEQRHNQRPDKLSLGGAEQRRDIQRRDERPGQKSTHQIRRAPPPLAGHCSPPPAPCPPRPNTVPPGDELMPVRPSSGE
ncbi:alkaline phosphatase-like isoform X2 [Apis florea]|uniref:alkaline phosphatase-like isoform X2 n=1 Tax=Apis florea TaxID=7463 RepID=UPI0012FEEAB7|nr:alkaline phosphatase-like isoform X2 [Apis florea]